MQPIKQKKSSPSKINSLILKEVISFQVKEKSLAPRPKLTQKKQIFMLNSQRSPYLSS